MLTTTVIQFQEKNFYPYIFIDVNNQVHVLPPIVDGSSISAANTCATFGAWNAFFSEHGGLNAVNFYIADLEADIAALTDQQASLSPMHVVLLAQKNERLQQLKIYRPFLEGRYFPTRGMSSGYPAGINSLLSSQNSNCYAIRLSPRSSDPYLNLENPVFSMNRYLPGFGSAIRDSQQIRDVVSNFRPLVRPVYPALMERMWDKYGCGLVLSSLSENTAPTVEMAQKISRAQAKSAVIFRQEVAEPKGGHIYFLYRASAEGGALAPVEKRDVPGLCGTGADALDFPAVGKMQVIEKHEVPDFMRINLPARIECDDTVIDALRVELLEIASTECHVGDLNLSRASTTGAEVDLNLEYFETYLVAPESHYEAVRGILDSAYNSNDWGRFSQSASTSFFSLEAVYCERQDLFEDGSKLNRMSLLAQFFFAKVNIYCLAHGVSSRNFGFALDYMYASNVCEIIAENLQSENVEKALLHWINDRNYLVFGMWRQLTKSEMNNIIAGFNNDWKAIGRVGLVFGDNPHFDEYLLCVDKAGPFKVHQERIVMHFSDYLRAVDGGSSEFLDNKRIQFYAIPELQLEGNNVIGAKSIVLDNPVAMRDSDLIIHPAQADLLYSMAIEKDENCFERISAHNFQNGVVLVAAHAGVSLDAERLHRISEENIFLPILIKQGEEFHCYGYTPEGWQVTYRLDAIKFNNLDFPKKSGPYLIGKIVNLAQYEGSILEEINPEASRELQGKRVHTLIEAQKPLRLTRALEVVAGQERGSFDSMVMQSQGKYLFRARQDNDSDMQVTGVIMEQLSVRSQGFPVMTLSPSKVESLRYALTRQYPAPSTAVTYADGMPGPAAQLDAMLTLLGIYPYDGITAQDNGDFQIRVPASAVAVINQIHRDRVYDDIKKSGWYIAAKVFVSPIVLATAMVVAAAVALMAAIRLANAIVETLTPMSFLFIASRLNYMAVAGVSIAWVRDFLSVTREAGPLPHYQQFAPEIMPKVETLEVIEPSDRLQEFMSGSSPDDPQVTEEFNSTKHSSETLRFQSSSPVAMGQGKDGFDVGDKASLSPK